MRSCKLILDWGKMQDLGDGLVSGFAKKYNISYHTINSVGRRKNIFQVDGSNATNATGQALKIRFLTPSVCFGTDAVLIVGE